jgi:ribosomal protein S18 acetylase RimI-like enzyme
MRLKRLPTHPLHGSISAMLPDLQLAMLPDLQLRPLGPDEWQVLRDARLNALRESPQSFLAKYDQEEMYGRERWQAELDRGDWLVGELDGKQVYLTGVTHESGAPADERYLEYVWVAPEFRRRLVAFEVLSGIIGTLKESGVRTVLLWIHVDNDPARWLYKQLDFITTNELQELDPDLGGGRWERLTRDLI